MAKLSVSILSCYDILTGINQLNKTDCDYIHIDVMDGKFVSNSFDPYESLKDYQQYLKKPIDVHLMVNDVKPYIEKYKDLTPEYITIQAEIDEKIEEAIALIHKIGCKAGISLKPNTPLSTIEKQLPQLDLVLVMTVEPGSGGQTFQKDMVPKITALKQMITNQKRKAIIQVDGGINEDTAKLAIDAGADLLVSGSFVTSGIMEEQVKKLKRIEK